MNPEIIASNEAPRPIGPYVQAMACGPLLFLSGQIALDPATGIIKGETVEQQTKQVMENISAVLRAYGLTVSSIVKTTVFLRCMDDFALFNHAYEAGLNGWKPARSVIEVSRLPKNALVEIETVACR